MLSKVSHNSSLGILEQLFSTLAEHKAVQTFVHGSWADDSKTPFSDLDDFIIINDEILTPGELNEIYKKLEKIELKLQRLDPLQHHGHWIATSGNLKNYDNSYIPLHILKSAIPIRCNPAIDAVVNQVKTRRGLAENLVINCRNIRSFYRKYENDELNIYDLKCFVSAIALIPPLLFQLRGEEVDKRTAIGRASELFSVNALKLLRWSSEKRSNWGRVINDPKYLSFSSRLKEFSNAREWRLYAEKHAPVIQCSDMSSIIINEDIVSEYVTVALNHVDRCQFRHVDESYYHVAYAQFETAAMEYGALSVGYFGNISWPSISDLDVLVCFQDSTYKEGVQRLNELIESSDQLSYCFMHSPVYVSESMMPWVKFVHTLNGLSITKGDLELNVENIADLSYSTFLNDIWSYYFLCLGSKIVDEIDYFSTRFLTLVLKNLHTSIYNIERTFGIESGILEEGLVVRRLVISDFANSRPHVEKAFVRAYSKLSALAGKAYQDSSKVKTCFIVDRSLFIQRSNEFCIMKKGAAGKEMHLGGYLYERLYKIYRATERDSEVYLNALSQIASVQLQLELAQFPLETPISEQRIYLHHSKRNTIKAWVWKIVNSLPDELIKRVFRMIN